MSNKSEIWNQIRANLQSKLPYEEFKTWFSQTSLKTFDFDLALINVPNKFFADWLEDRYLVDIKTAFKDQLDQSPKIHFTYPLKGEDLEFQKAPPVQKKINKSKSPNLIP